MIKEIYLPKWLSCIKSNYGLEFEEISEEELQVVSCASKHECYGCDPTGSIIKKDILNLEEVKHISSMCVPLEKLDNYFFTDEYIEELEKEYENRLETFYYTRDIVCDLDTITIYRSKS